MIDDNFQSMDMVSVRIWAGPGAGGHPCAGRHLGDQVDRVRTPGK